MYVYEIFILLVMFSQLLYWSHNTQDNMGGPQVKMPGAIPLTQFKVKSTMIWNSIWLMVIDLNLNKKWPK